MLECNKGSRDAPKPYKPTEKDFTQGEVAKAVLAESLQHPATIYPLAGSVVAMGITLIIAASPLSIGLAVGGVAVSAGSFIYQYVVKGEEKAAAHVSKLRELKRQSEMREVNDLSLRCSEIGFDDGAKSATQLTAAYQRLLNYFKEHLAQKQDPTLERFQMLAEETYQQGEQVVQQALDVFKAVGTANVQTLDLQVKDWKNKRAKLQDDSTDAAILDQKIQENSKRIELCRRLSELCLQVNKICSALESTYLDLVNLGNQDPVVLLDTNGGAATRLQSAVDAARQVERRLRGIDESAAQAERNKKYLNAAQDAQPNQ